MLVRSAERWAILCARCFTAWRARFFACLVLAKVVLQKSKACYEARSIRADASIGNRASRRFIKKSAEGVRFSGLI